MSVLRRTTTLLGAGAVTAAASLTAMPAAHATSSWGELVNAVTAGGTIHLGAHITAPGGEHLPVPADTDVDLNLNGWSLTISWPDTGDAGIEVPPGSSLRIWDAVRDSTTNRLTVTGGQFGAGIGGSEQQGHGDITIDHSIVTATGGEYGAGIGTGHASVDASGTISIVGGDITATGGIQAAGIGGGNETGGGDISIEIAPYNDSLTVSSTGGSHAAGIGAGNNGDRDDATITLAADVTAVGGSNAAGIGGGRNVNGNSGGGGDITIEAGTVSATGGQYGAGIGGGENGTRTDSAITVNGGVVTASGGADGAGIGGGFRRDGGNITIDGGEVTATGGARGAGIGAANQGDRAGSTIRVTSGTVLATGGDQAAGIGSGRDAVEDGEDDGEVVVEGGAITAGGGEGGAGIGGGHLSGGGDITIEGGTVNAIGGAKGAAIGSGTDGDRGGHVVTIAGGTVTATGGTLSAGIGGAHDGSAGAVTIAGGTTTAGAGSLAAAIGGGHSGPGGAIDIGAQADVTVAGARAFGRGVDSEEAWGSLSNAGSVLIQPGSTLRIPGGVTTTNSGAITNFGSIDGTGTITNTGRILGNGPISNGGFGAPGVLIETNNYLLDLQINGVGSGPDPEFLTVRAATVDDAGLSLPTPVPTEGYLFRGWYTEETGGTRVTDTTDLAEALADSGPLKATLYAQEHIPQEVEFTSTAPTGAKVGGSYTPTVTGGGSGQPVVLSVDDDTTNAACTVANGVVTLAHTGTCVVAANQAGAGDYTAAPTATQSFAVTAVATTTDVSVGGAALTATVKPVSGAAVASGTVAFTVGGAPVGSAPLVNGVATLAHTVATGGSRTVEATYGGTADFVGSSDSASRNDPTIVATRSAEPNRHGWYAAPVTVAFACTPTTATLSTPCPAPVTLAESRASQTATGTVTATDGGAATASVSGINIDRTAPTVRVTGVKKGKTYTGKAPKPRCVGADALSGVDRCTLTKKTKKLKKGKGKRITYTATAYDKAGNKRTTKGTYVVR